ncbi:uncharacterized protein LOC128865323 [Anastrepha ludens]|uniref:uncharacterized protein LOC128865323 n=1 Tax=Anastrepha ludens TaxID=28586 RepID=UPI0023B008B8|nr:uncharacterized protein LOC128865323 [Anastrepha ludens]
MRIWGIFCGIQAFDITKGYYSLQKEVTAEYVKQANSYICTTRSGGESFHSYDICISHSLLALNHSILVDVRYRIDFTKNYTKQSIGHYQLCKAGLKISKPKCKFFAVRRQFVRLS